MKKIYQNGIRTADRIDEKGILTRIIELLAPTLVNSLDVLMVAAEHDDWNYGHSLIQRAIDSSSTPDGKYRWEIPCPECKSRLRADLPTPKHLFLLGVIHILRAIIASHEQIDSKDRNIHSLFEIADGSVSCNDCGFSGYRLFESN